MAGWGVRGGVANVASAQNSGEVWGLNDIESLKN